MNPNEFVNGYLFGVSEIIDYHVESGHERSEVELFYLHMAIMSYDYQVTQNGRNARYALKRLVKNEKKIFNEIKGAIKNDKNK